MIREEDSIISTAICRIASMYPLSNGTNVIGITNDVMDKRYGIANRKNVGLE